MLCHMLYVTCYKCNLKPVTCEAKQNCMYRFQNKKSLGNSKVMSFKPLNNIQYNMLKLSDFRHILFWVQC